MPTCRPCSALAVDLLVVPLPPSLSALQGLKVGGVYTYGSPKVGDGRFRDLYGQLGLTNVTWRYVHKNDAVPQVGSRMMAIRASDHHGWAIM